MDTNTRTDNSTKSAIGGDSFAHSRSHAATSSATSPVVDEKLRCRYSNKKCMNPRTNNRMGGLHTFCDEHRDAANRNQRRIDQRKRAEKRQLESIQAYYETLQAAAEHANNSQALPQAHQLLSHNSRVPVVGAATPVVAEPFTRPAALLDEDVNILVSLFGPADLGDSRMEEEKHGAF